MKRKHISRLNINNRYEGLFIDRINKNAFIYYRGYKIDYPFDWAKDQIEDIVPGKLDRIIRLLDLRDKKRKEAMINF